MARQSEGATLYWLESGDGRVLVRHGGLLLGRSADCDIVLADARVSRHQLLLRTADRGVELIPLGRAAVTVDGEAVTTTAALREGSTIALCGRQFRLVATVAPPTPDRELVWAIETRGGSLHRIARSPFTVGGGADDDLHFPSWPAATMVFTVVQRALVLEVTQPGVSGNESLVEGEVATVRPGARLRFHDQEIRLVPVPTNHEAFTAPEEGEELPRRVLLEFLPRGGRLTVAYGSWERSTWLADRRCDLVATLLSPPSPYAAGEAVPDDVLIPRVWPGGQQGRVELNTLVFRTRKDLVKADLDGGTLLHRAEGIVRFSLAPGASVTVRSGA